MSRHVALCVTRIISKASATFSERSKKYLIHLIAMSLPFLASCFVVKRNISYQNPSHRDVAFFGIMFCYKLISEMLRRSQKVSKKYLLSKSISSLCLCLFSIFPRWQNVPPRHLQVEYSTLFTYRTSSLTDIVSCRQSQCRTALYIAAAADSNRAEISSPFGR
jgi:hypothetical protein